MQPAFINYIEKVYQYERNSRDIMKNVTLVLEDGTKFLLKIVGYDAPVADEVVFNTAMMGYPESLTRSFLRWAAYGAAFL